MGKSEFKACPYCGEEILSSAVKCKHCGEFLDKTLARTRSATQEKVIVKPRGEGCFLQTLNLGCVVVFIIIAVIVISIIAISNQTSSPPSTQPKPTHTTPSKAIPTTTTAKENVPAAFKAPKLGDRITLVRRIGGEISGTITAIGKDTISLDGRSFQSDQLTPETCDAVFPEARAARLAPSPTPSQSVPTSKPTVDLKATVGFDDTQFVIANGDSFDWTKVKMEINSKTFSGGYTLKTSVIKAGETYTVGAMQFAKSDGERFNPFTYKAVNLSIYCDTPKGRGFYYGTWK